MKIFFCPAGDKFCADIETHEESLKSVSNSVKDQQKKIEENNETLKGITNESFGKLKEMVNNCMQVETNIRSIRDKSILFDNDIKTIKDQLVHMKRDKSKSRPPSADAEFLKKLNMKDEEIKAISEMVKDLKRKLQTTSSEMNNLKEDKRTRDLETEERQASLEILIEDVRGWVETMLNESNKQLGDIAVEVENANVKISKCATDLGEVFVQHANNTGDMTFVKKNLEDKINEVKEYGNIQQRELLDKILDLRGSFVDNQTEFVEKVKITNESISTLREELNSKVDKLDSSMSRKFETKPKNGVDSSDTTKKVDLLRVDLDKLKSEASQLVAENKEKFSKANSEIAALRVSCESSSSSAKKVGENLTKIEKELLEKMKENNKVIEENKIKLENTLKLTDFSKKDLESMKENQNRFDKDLKLNEKKNQDLSTQMQEMKKLKENVDEKLKAAQENFESTLNENLKVKSFSSADSESKILLIKKDLDHVKNEIKNADLESFKNVVNNTTETHNKLICAVQKSVDLIICEKTILESQTAVLDSKLTDFITEREVFETQTKDKLTRLNDTVEVDHDQLTKNNTMLTELENKVDLIEKLRKSLDEIESTLSSLKFEFNQRLKEIQQNTTENKDNINKEIITLKKVVESNNQSSSEQQKKEFKEAAKNLQEKSDANINKINEAFEVIHNQSKVLDNLTESINQVSRNYEFSDAQIQKVELKLTSCIDELSKLDLFVTAAEMKKLERTVNEKSNKYGINEVDSKIDIVKQDFETTMRNMNTKLGHLDESVKDFYSKLENINDFNNFYNDVQALSSKVNQQKAKMIDLEANITMQDRITSKLSDDLKKASIGMNKIGSPIGKTNSSDVVNGDDHTASKFKDDIVDLKSALSKKADFSDLNKMKSSLKDETEQFERNLKEFSVTLMNIKKNLDSKTLVWDKKSDSTEVTSIKNTLQEEIRKIQNHLNTLNERNSEINETIKTNSKKQDDSDFGSKMTLQALETQFFKKDEVRAIENNILGTVSKMERNFSNIDSSNKTVGSKIVEVEKKMNDYNEKFSNLLSFKTKIDQKVSVWDKKADNEQLKQIESTLNEEISKLKNTNNGFQDKLKEFQNQSKNNNSEKNVTESFGKYEKQLSSLESSSKETIQKVNDITKRYQQQEKDIQNLGALKSSLESLKNKTDQKAEAKLLDSLSAEFKNFKSDVDNTKEKVDKMSNEVGTIKTNSSVSGIEKKLNENVGKFENRFAIIENFKRDVETKIQDLNNSSNNDSFSELKSKFDSKVNNDEFKKLDAFIKDELKKTRKDLEYTLEKCDDLHTKVSAEKKSNDTDEVRRIGQQVNSFDTRINESIIGMNDCRKKLEQITTEVNGFSTMKTESDTKCKNIECSIESLQKDRKEMNDAITKLKQEINTKIEKLSESKTETKTKNEMLASETEKCLKQNIENVQSSLNSDISAISDKYSSLYSSVENMRINLDKLDKGAVNKHQELKQIENDLNSEMKKLKSSIEFALNKSDDLSMQLQNATTTQSNNVSSDSLNQIEKNINIALEKSSSNISDLTTKLNGLLSKSSSWDNKVEKADLITCKNEINSSIDNLRKDIGSTREEVNVQKQEIQSLESTTKNLTSLQSQLDKSDKSENVSKSLEGRITAGMAQIENKMAIFESSRKEMNTKLVDLSSKQQKINEEFGGISEIKEKMKSKSEIWDNKADVKSVESMIKTELDKVKSEGLNQSQKFESDMKSMKDSIKATDEIGRKFSNFENKIIDEVKSMQSAQKSTVYAKTEELSKLSEEIKSIKLETSKTDIYARKEELSKLMQDINVIKSSSNKNDIYAKKEELSNLNNKFATFEKQKEEISKLTQDINNLKVSSDKADIYAKKEDISKLTQDINALKSSTNTTDIFARKEELSNMSNKFTTVEKQVNSLETGLKEVKDNVKIDKEIILKMQEDVKSFNKVSSDMKSSIANDVKQIISSEITKVNDKISNSNSNQQGNNKVTDQMESALKKVEESVKAEKEKLQAVENTINCLDVKSFAKKDEIAKIIDLTNYATIDEISKGFVKQDVIANCVKKSEISGFVKKEEMKNEFKSNLDSDIKQLKTFINEEISNLKKSGSSDGKQDISSLKSNFISKEEFTVLGMKLFKNTSINICQLSISFIAYSRHKLLQAF